MCEDVPRFVPRFVPMYLVYLAARYIFHTLLGQYLGRFLLWDTEPDILNDTLNDPSLAPPHLPYLPKTIQRDFTAIYWKRPKK
jgi:hypothetical protein